MVRPGGGGGGDSYRPQYRRDDGPPPPPPDMFQFRGAAGGRDRRDADGRSDFTFHNRAKISDRPLLRTRRNSRGEEVLGGANAFGDKFRNLDELTDSDEAEMEDSDEDGGDRPVNKRARLENGTAEKPKWSNPDVYTSLPAPSETTGKKLDFVKLIRKAKNTDTKSKDITANGEDFISFEDLDDAHAAPVGAPTGPKMQNTDRALGKRKRGESSGTNLVTMRGKSFYKDGMILDEWNIKDGIHSTPWLQLHPEERAGLALHKEVIDFYEWVKPRDYEFRVRAGVIDRLSAALNRLEPGELKAFGSYAAGLYLPIGDMDLVYMLQSFQRRQTFHVKLSGTKLRKFCDFIKKCGVAQPESILLIAHAKVPIIKYIDKVSGLKVDLSFNNDTGVVAIDTFRKWQEQYPAMPILVSVIKQFLMIRGLNDVAVGGLGGFSIICLVTSVLQHMPLSSTPPNLGELLVEFFNLYGNLFNRDSIGIRMEPPAYVNKDTYASFMMGPKKDKNGRLMIIDPNRSDNNISGGTHAIETIFECFSRAHGTLQTRLSDYEDHDIRSGQGFSFLEDLVGGDFTAYEAQREILYTLHHGRAGPAPAIVPPPPPPIHHPLPPVPPPPTDDPHPTKESRKRSQAARGAGSRKSRTADSHPSTKDDDSKKTTKAQRRAIRLKTLRPELASLINRAISLNDALKIGKYKDFNDMDRDLTKREHDLETNGS